MKFILASASRSRKALLKEIGFVPNICMSTDINETPKKKEKPRLLAIRLAKEKSLAAMEKIKDKSDIVVLSADTVVAVGSRIIDKALNNEDIYKNMKMLSGRNHRVFSGFNIVQTNKDGDIIRTIAKVVTTRVKFKSLSDIDIRDLIASNTGIGVAGGYTINNFGASFAISIIGSHTNIMGLPLYQVRNSLLTIGLKSVLTG
ncbi:MAG: septum formation protein Maf [Alphaproteobacteria bacterium]|nr:septum formation protein Maf [Rickettsiales bacterium]